MRHYCKNPILDMSLIKVSFAIVHKATAKYSYCIYIVYHLSMSETKYTVYIQYIVIIKNRSVVAQYRVKILL